MSPKDASAISGNCPAACLYLLTVDHGNGKATWGCMAIHDEREPTGSILGNNLVTVRGRIQGNPIAKPWRHPLCPLKPG